MNRVILMKKYEKLDHGCCEDCIAEFKTKLCAGLCLYLNDNNPCMGHWELRGEVTEIEIVEAVIKRIELVGGASCVALEDYGADKSLVEKYRAHSGACSGGIGFSDYDFTEAIPADVKTAIRVKKLTAFLESLKGE